MLWPHIVQTALRKSARQLEKLFRRHGASAWCDTGPDLAGTAADTTPPQKPTPCPFQHEADSIQCN